MSFGLVVIHQFEHFLQIGERIIHPFAVDKALASHPGHVVKVALTDEEAASLAEAEKVVVEDKAAPVEEIPDAAPLALPALVAADTPPKAEPSDAS